VADLQTVTEEAIAEAVRFLFYTMKLVVEPSGALGCGAALGSVDGEGQTGGGDPLRRQRRRSTMSALWKDVAMSLALLLVASMRPPPQYRRSHRAGASREYWAKSEAQFAVPAASRPSSSCASCRAISARDPELRDELAAGIAMQWIFEQKLLAPPSCGSCSPPGLPRT